MEVLIDLSQSCVVPKLSLRSPTDIVVKLDIANRPCKTNRDKRVAQKCLAL